MKTYDITNEKIKGGGARCIFFCYPQIGSPFAVKGQWMLVQKKAKEIIGENNHALVHIHSQEKFQALDHFRCKVSTKIVPTTTHSFISHHGLSLRISELRFPKNQKEYSALNHKVRKRYFVECGDKVLAFRRIPRSWIKELDPIIKNLDQKIKERRDACKRIFKYTSLT